MQLLHRLVVSLSSQASSLLHQSQESSQVDAVCSFAPTLSNTCMQRLLGDCSPLRKTPSSVVCLRALCSLGLDLEVIKLTHSGVLYHTSVCKLLSGWSSRAGPWWGAQKSHHEHWMEQGGTLAVTSSFPFLSTPTLADLDSLLEQKPGFLSGSSLPILETGETTGCPTHFPKPSVRVGLYGISAVRSVSLTLPPATGTGECTLFSRVSWGSPNSSSLLL